MPQLNLTLISYPDVIFPHQSLCISIFKTSPLFNTPLQGNTVGVCFNRNKSNATFPDNLYDVGVTFYVESETIEDNSPHSLNHFKVIVGKAIQKFKINKFLSSDAPIKAEVELLLEDLTTPKEDLMKDKNIYSLRLMANDYIDMVKATELIKRPTPELSTKGPLSCLLYTIASYLRVSNEVKYNLLTIENHAEKAQKLAFILREELNREQARSNIRRQAREAFRQEVRRENLQGELENINQELSGPRDKELNNMEEQIKKIKLPKETLDVLIQEFNRLKQMNNKHPEYTIQKKYLETVIELPWNNASEEVNSLDYAEIVLNKQHAGLEKIKNRILEFMAVKMLNKNSKGSILCFQGPPGVGKTSLGKSIADALGRKFERISLGGVSDEAEIRGHRRTYMGSMPGLLINALIKCKTNNPVILLDEIDKLGRGSSDPSSALLEVLDPSQNHSFKDHYLGVPFDLSNVLFIATSNNLDSMQAPLLDRMELITLSGYTREEKTEIAKKHLIQRQVYENGLKNRHIEFPDSSIRFLVDYYTREAGVRNLERHIGSLCRKVAFEFLKSQQLQMNSQEDAIVVRESHEFERIKITEEYIEQELGPRIYDDDITQDIHEPGMAFGMAWTPTGGKILLVEASISRGQERLTITGKLGNIMKESVLTSLGWIKSQYKFVSLLTVPEHSGEKSEAPKPISLGGRDLHVHFPAAAVPKDGPSAGITITVALVSLLTGRKVRNDVSMTGEISLKGAVLPVGGVKEKCLAAYERGIKRVILPEKNRADVEEMSKEARDNMTFHFVKDVKEAIKLAIELHTSEGAEADVLQYDVHHKPKL